MIDIINAIFEFLALGFAGLNIRRLVRDRKTAGLHPASCTFYLLWNVWSVLFYAHYAAWFSFISGVFLTLVNLTWFGLMVYYAKTRSQ